MTKFDQHPLGIHFDEQESRMAQTITHLPTSARPNSNWHELGALLEENPELKLQRNDEIHRIVGNHARANLGIYHYLHKMDSHQRFRRAADTFNENRHFSALASLDNAVNEVILANPDAFPPKVLLRIFRIKKSIAREIIAVFSEAPINWQKVPINHLTDRFHLNAALIDFWKELAIPELRKMAFEQIQIIKSPLNPENGNYEIFITPKSAQATKNEVEKKVPMEIYQEYSETAEPDSSVNQCFSVALADQSIGTCLVIPQAGKPLSAESLGKLKSVSSKLFNQIKPICDQILEYQAPTEEPMHLKNPADLKRKNWFRSYGDSVEINFKCLQNGQLIFGKIILDRSQTVLASNFYLRVAPEPLSTQEI